MLELLTGLLVTAGLSPVVRRAALRHGILDIPNHRSSHAAPTPRAGGLACLGGALAAGLAAWAGARDVPWTCLVGAAVLAVVGLADDRVGLPASTRLGAQLVVGAVVGVTLGGPLVGAAGALLVATAVNGVNFMDGINGITGLTMAVWGVATLASGMRADSMPLAVLGGLTTGVALGFLPFNFPRPRVFLGDVGSYLFGGLVGSGLLLAWEQDVPVLVVAAPLAVYAADTGLTLCRRAVRRERLGEAHREHVYQRLTSGVGLPHAVVAPAAALLAGLCALAWWTVPGWPAAAATVLLCGLYVASPHLLQRTGGVDRVRSR